MAAKRICSIEGCGKEHYARGWCSIHYHRHRLHGDPLAYKIPKPKPCSVGGCDKIAKARGLCDKHYQRLVKHGSPELGAFKPKGVCSYPGCDKPHLSLGYCSKHLARWQSKGDPSIGRAPAKKLGLKFVYEQAVSFEGEECLLWPYGISSNGYGAVDIDNRKRGAHVVVCELVHGPKPEPRHEVAHSCGVRACCNPAHLRWASRSNNHADKVRHGTAQRGAKQNKAKLTEEQVREIRALEGQLSVYKTAKRFGVNPWTISNIWARQIWAWLE